MFWLFDLICFTRAANDYNLYSILMQPLDLVDSSQLKLNSRRFCHFLLRGIVENEDNFL